MSEINAKVNEAYVSSVIEGLDRAYVKMDEARIWARRQAFLLGGGVLAAVTGDAVASDNLATVLWVIVALTIVGAIDIELGKYTDADNESAEEYNAAMDLVEFVDPEEKQDGINL